MQHHVLSFLILHLIMIHVSSSDSGAGGSGTKLPQQQSHSFQWSRQSAVLEDGSDRKICWCLRYFTTLDDNIGETSNKRRLACVAYCTLGRWRSGTHLCPNSNGKHLSGWSSVYNGRTRPPSGHRRALLLKQYSHSPPERSKFRDTFTRRADKS